MTWPSHGRDRVSRRMPGVSSRSTIRVKRAANLVAHLAQRGGKRVVALRHSRLDAGPLAIGGMSKASARLL